MSFLLRWFDRFMEYDRARVGLRAICETKDDYRGALVYARRCGWWGAETLRYLATALAYGFGMPEAVYFHEHGIPIKQMDAWAVEDRPRKGYPAKALADEYLRARAAA